MLIGVTVLLAIVSGPHVREDFYYGDRVLPGLTSAYGVLALAAVYLAQALGIVLTLRADPRGAWLLAAMGAVWCAGAVIVHGHDVLFADVGYRHGAVSRILEAAIIVLGAAAAALGFRVAASPGGTDLLS